MSNPLKTLHEVFDLYKKTVDLHMAYRIMEDKNAHLCYFLLSHNFYEFGETDHGLACLNRIDKKYFKEEYVEQLIEDGKKRFDALANGETPPRTDLAIASNRLIENLKKNNEKELALEIEGYYNYALSVFISRHCPDID